MWQDIRIAKNKSILLPYTNDKQAKKEIGEKSPFTLAPNSIKYLGIRKKLKKITENENIFLAPEQVESTQ